MTYTTGQLIQATDYNSIGWSNPSIGGHWGIGTGNHGLGQSTSGITQVAPAAKVMATQWSAMLSTINSCLLHHNQAQISVAPSTITIGQPIKAFTQLVTGSALAYNSVGVSNYVADGTANVTLFSGNWGTTAQGVNRTLEFNQSVTFTSGDAARYFFNAGGKIKLVFSRTGGTSNAINTSWSNICAAPGTVSIGYNNTTKTSASTAYIRNSNDGGYWGAGTSYVMHLQQYESAGGGYYGSDYLKVDLQWAGSLSNGGHSVLNIRTSLVNGSGVLVNGLTSTSLVVTSPTTGAGLANTWGSPVFAGSTALN